MPDISPSNEPSDALRMSMLDTDQQLAADADSKLATQEAVKTHIDGVKRKTYING